MSETYVPVTSENAFPAEGKYSAAINGWQVLIVRVDDGYRAYNDRCSHAASPLSTGRIRRGAIMCPLHGARFDLATGACLGAAYPALLAFPVRVEGGMIEVAMPTRAPDMNELPVRIT